MKRLVLALMAVLLAACGPSAKINADDPFATLHPWNPKWKQVKTTQNGVQYIVLKHGDAKGVHPTPADEVEVTYDGRLASDATKFDATPPGETATFRLGQVIPGWTEGLQQMVPGDEFMFFIPSAQAYGPRGAGGVIPPDADLMFHVALKKVVPAAAVDVEAWKKALPWPTDSADVKRTASGLEYMIVQSGPDGAPSPKDSDYAVVHYEGRLDDGSTFDSSYERMEPAMFPIEGLVPGFSEALKLMKEGDHWMIRLPSSLAYGSESNGRIPPDSPLTFEVQLQKVINVPAGPPGVPPQQ